MEKLEFLGLLWETVLSFRASMKEYWKDDLEKECTEAEQVRRAITCINKTGFGFQQTVKTPLTDAVIHFMRHKKTDPLTWEDIEKIEGAWGHYQSMMVRVRRPFP
ncbi:MAG: hypothetical protein CEO12_480 [Parcubacteria group bacterium Gr01-1014_46]|nr:MAG: hypothetical protein CEO12_480 [Parcubacteria group bacterium Gr01-1014_46]